MKLIKAIPLIPTLLVLACGSPARKIADEPTAQEHESYNSYRAYDYFVRGDLYEQSGDYEKAAEMYRSALIYDPSSSEIRRILSNVYFRQGRFNEAAVLRSEITEKTAEDYNFIGNCLQYTKDFAGAADFYEHSLDIDSTQYLPRKFLAAILEKLGNYAEAEKHYKKAVHYSPAKKEGLIDLGVFYLEIEKYGKAIETFDEALQPDSTDMRVVTNLGLAMMSKGDTVGADSLYRKVMDKNWGNPSMLQALVPLFFTVNDIESAEKASGKIAELYPDDPDILRNYALILFGTQQFDRAESLLVEIDEKGMANSDVYYYLGRIKQSNEDYGEAEKYYRKSLALEDSLSDTWINLALSVDRQGRYDEALELMQRAMGKIPSDTTEILFYTSLIHSRNEKYDLALEGYNRLLESQPDNLQFRFNLAASYERLGDFDSAERHFEQVLETDPGNALALNYLGYMYADRGVKLSEAKNMIKKALEIDPENGAYLDSYAWVLYKLGDYEEAIVPMKKAVESDQEDPILYDHQGDIYAALDQMDKAVESWKKALELDPDNEEIRAKLNSR